MGITNIGNWFANDRLFLVSMYMYLHGDVQNGEIFSENMLKAGIEPATSQTAAKHANCSATSAFVHFAQILSVCINILSYRYKYFFR